MLRSHKSSAVLERLGSFVKHVEVLQHLICVDSVYLEQPGGTSNREKMEFAQVLDKSYEFSEARNPNPMWMLTMICGSGMRATLLIGSLSVLVPRDNSDCFDLG